MLVVAVIFTLLIVSLKLVLKIKANRATNRNERHPPKYVS